MAEKQKKLSKDKLYLDESLKSVVTKSGGDGEHIKILIDRFSFVVFDPNTDYKDLESSLETLLQDVRSEIDHRERKKAQAGEEPSL